jgi:RNA polymerase sigma factor (sigma-70 family)
VITDGYYETAKRASNPLASDAEETLIMLAKDGDKSAYTELYRLHSRRVFLTILRITKNRDDAEDVLQETSMKAFRHLSGFDGRSRFSTWLTRIGINSALMLRRKTHCHSEFSIKCESAAGSFVSLQVADERDDPEHQMRSMERRNQLNGAIQRLPRTLREPLELQLAEELSVKDLANRLGLSVPATKSRLMRARTQLRRWLARSNHLRPNDAML